MVDYVTSTFDFIVNVLGYPNVVIEVVTVNGTVISPGQTVAANVGDTLSIAVSIKNQGDGPGYCWAQLIRKDTNTIIGSKQGTTLDPGMSTTVSWSWTVPEELAGGSVTLEILAGYTG